MHVRFTYSQEDMVDANFRMLRRSRHSHYWRWQATALVVLFFWLAIYVIFVSFLRNLYLAAIEFVVITIATVALYPAFYDRAIIKRLRRYAQEAYGGKNDFVCEVELTPNDIRISGENTQSAYEWKTIEEVVVTADSVDIFLRSGGVVVRNRAFESPSQRDEFIALAKGYAAGHGESACTK